MASLFLIGGNGHIGQHLLREAQSLNHKVTALYHQRPLASAAGVTPVKGDIKETSALLDHIQGHDAVISAYSPGLSSMGAEAAAAEIALAHDSLFRACEAAKIGRLILVGGVGSLQAGAGFTGDVVDAPFYPQSHRAYTLQNRAILRELQAGKWQINWTYVSPPLEIYEGPKLGKVQWGRDYLLRDLTGRSHISRADFAAGILVALERKLHIKERFTLAY